MVVVLWARECEREDTKLMSEPGPRLKPAKCGPQSSLVPQCRFFSTFIFSLFMMYIVYFIFYFF